MNNEILRINDFVKKYKDFHFYCMNKDDVYIAEISGQDSIAAIIEVIKNENVEKIYPTAVYHNAMIGDFLAEQKNIYFLKKSLKNPSIIFPLISIDVSDIFNTIVLRNMGIVQVKYGFYSPCPPCHLLFHLIRVVIAKILGIKKIITGEREKHDKMIKINQTPQILDYFYKMIKSNYQIELIQPLRKISSTTEITKILGKNWDSSLPQTGCILSKNYLDENKNPIMFDDNIWKKQLNEFYLPKFQYIIH
ncbi:MAG: hypothetical protein ACTSQO_10610 [Candidatus Helarchaeota archaeon]